MENWPRTYIAAMQDAAPLDHSELAHDAWNVMRRLLPVDAGIALLLAAREAAFELLDRISAAERRDGLHPATAHLLDLGRMSAIGRIAMLDNWRSQLRGAALIPGRPYGEDTDYARAMRLRPEKLREIIAIVDEQVSSDSEERFRAMMEIAKRAARRPVFDRRRPDEIIGYK
jgi:hypothetical protein